MEHLGLFLLLLLVSAVPFVRSSYQGDYRNNYLFIDCGASTETPTNNSLIKWEKDESFIQTGQNCLLISNQNFNIMNTLRFFPRGTKNCYKLPFYASENKFLIRAGFYYGNYDGLNKPPSFNLELDDSLWTTVTTSMSDDEPIYHEVIYRTRGDSATVCLVRTINDEVPFISLLEATIIDDGDYRLMENETALYLHTRINYGANRSIEELIGPNEEYLNRVWKSNEMAEYLNIALEIILLFHEPIPAQNSPPSTVMATAIQAKNVSDSIHLSIDFPPQILVVAYFVLYFMDPVWRFSLQNQTSKVEIYIDNRKLDAMDVPQWGRYGDPSFVVSFYPVWVFGSANVTISPVQGTTLAPILNATWHYIDVSKGEKLLYLQVALSFIFLHLFSSLVL